MCTRWCAVGFAGSQCCSSSRECGYFSLAPCKGSDVGAAQALARPRLMEWKFKTHRDAIMIASYPSPYIRGQQRADGVVKEQENCLGL